MRIKITLLFCFAVSSLFGQTIVPKAEPQTPEQYEKNKQTVIKKLEQLFAPTDPVKISRMAKPPAPAYIKIIKGNDGRATLIYRCRYTQAKSLVNAMESVISSSATVEQNIEVPMVYGEIPKHIRRNTAKELAEQVGLGHRLKHRPTELSGGECQRIAVARALSNKPSFLLADEPTGNLDEKTSFEIMEMFHDLHREKDVTILVVTHDPELKPIFDRIIHLRDGVIEK